MAENLEICQEFYFQYFKPKATILYGGMRADVYAPFKILDAKKVIGIDYIDYELPYSKNMDNHTHNKIRLYQLYENVIKNINGLQPSKKKIKYTSIVIDDAKYYFQIRFRFNGKERQIDFYCFQYFENFTWDPKVDKVDYIMTKGAVLPSWNNFKPDVKKLWTDKLIISHYYDDETEDDLQSNEDPDTWELITKAPTMFEPNYGDVGPLGILKAITGE